MHENEPQTTRKIWVFEVVNKAAVPPEFLLIDQPRIRAAIRTGARKIPGLRIFQDEIPIWQTYSLQ